MTDRKKSPTTQQNSGNKATITKGHGQPVASNSRFISNLAQPRRTNTTPQNANKEGKTKGK